MLVTEPWPELVEYLKHAGLPGWIGRPIELDDTAYKAERWSIRNNKTETEMQKSAKAIVRVLVKQERQKHKASQQVPAELGWHTGLRLSFRVAVIILLLLILFLLAQPAEAQRRARFEIQDEGNRLLLCGGGLCGINHAGAGVVCAPPIGNIVTCTITGGGAGSQHQIDGVNLTSNDPINFLDTTRFDWTNPGAGNLSLALKAGFISGLGDFAAALCGTNQILEDQGASWACIATPAGGTTALSAIVAATGPNTINSGDNAQVWNWSLTTASKVAFKFGEDVASVATTNPILLNAVTLAASTAHPFQATSRGTANGIRVEATDGVLGALGTGGVDWPALLNYPTGCTNQFVRTIADTLTCNPVDLTADVTATLPVGSGGSGTPTPFTLGSVVFAGASGVYTQDNANLFWHDINNRLGIGTSAPDNPLSIVRTLNALADLAVEQNYHLKIQNTNDIDGQGVGISFGMSSTDDQQTGAIVARRTGSNGQGTLQFYTKQSTVTGVAPALVLALDQNGNVGIGVESPATSSLLELFSATKAFLPTRLTTANRDALTPVDGMILYNSTLARTQGRISAAWESFSLDTTTPTAADISGSLSAGYTIDPGAVASAELATANKTFPCNIKLFRDTGLKDTDDLTSVTACSRPGKAITVTAVIFETDAGSPIINLQRDDGTPANLLSSNCTGTTGGTTCSIDVAEDNFAATDKLDFVAVSGMSGANQIAVLIQYTVD